MRIFRAICLRKAAGGKNCRGSIRTGIWYKYLEKRDLIPGTQDFEKAVALSADEKFLPQKYFGSGTERFAKH